MSESSEQPADPHLEALRKVYAKLLEIERKVDSLATAHQAAMKLGGTKKKRLSPEFTLLQAKLMKAWAEAKGARYEFHPRDAKGIGSLLKRQMTIEALTQRWIYAFKNGCVSIFEFDMNFNKYVPVSGASRPQVDGATDLYGGKNEAQRR